MKLHDIYQNTRRPYYLYAPPWRRTSAGIKAMHLLCHYLNKIGEEAYVYTQKTNPLLRTPLLTSEVVTRHQTNAIEPVAVYPEVVQGNPFNARCVVRYILNHPGLLGGPKTFAASDLLVYYHPEYLDKTDKTGNIPMLLMPTWDYLIFNNDDNEWDDKRSGHLIYPGRYAEAKNKYPELFENATVITYEWPDTHEELALLLRKSKVLYCFANSAISSEARLCGCPVVLMDSPFSKRPDDYDPDKPDYFSTDPGFTRDASETAIELARRKTAKFRKKDLRLRQNFVAQLEHFIRLSQEMKPAIQERQNAMSTAIIAFNSNDNELAIERLTAALEETPENPLAYAYLAFICARQGLVLEAVDFMDKSARFAPDRADLQAALGETFLQAGQPDLAAGYLNEAVSAQPDLLAAYPALAQSLHLTGQSEMAVSLLQPAVGMPSPVQDRIQSVLLEILAQQGNLAEFTRVCLRFSHGIIDDLLAVRCFSHFEFSGEHLLGTLGKIQAQLADAGIGNRIDSAKDETLPLEANKPLKIAFMVSDFTREQRIGRLGELLCYLSTEKFMTLLIVNDRHGEHNDYFNLCSLLADQILIIFDDNDAAALEKIQSAAPDILIDLDAYDPLERLAIFLKAKIPHKLLWGEAPMPPLSPDCKVLAGLRMGVETQLPCVTLLGMGECYDFPELSASSSEISRTSNPVFGCLTPAMRVGREGWRLFAGVLNLHPGSQLLINLKDLGNAAQDFIRGEFARAGIAAERLRFVHAHSAEDLCKLWQEADLGLAPPVDAGDLALPTCLWMGKPYLALASPLPWGRRPAALLETVGAAKWIAETPEAYLELSRQIPPAPDALFRARMQAAGLNAPALFAQGFADSMINMLRDFSECRSQKQRECRSR
ncbi:MAG: tetratricopeptide repeat protein [Zoogloeaceae bacterium]|jgi:predicted O-linked N-acetylglucosamine transferase (SPINDLY family)|nr:tetratricopeptide repeat protein [Zoogloeaceae bacterium]